MMGGYGNYGYGAGSSMMGGGWLGFILMLAFGALVVAGIVMLVIWAVRSSAGHGTTAVGTTPPAGAVGHDEAVTIAKRRLASGEIDAEQYAAIVRMLNG